MFVPFYDVRRNGIEEKFLTGPNLKLNTMIVLEVIPAKS